MRQGFTPNWSLILVLAIPVWSILILLIMLITYPAIISVRDGTPFPSSWSWTGILLTDCGIIISGFAIVWGVVSGFLTEITETQIQRGLFFWHEEINFQEIKEIAIKNYRVILIDEKQKFQLNIMFYKNPDEVLSFIRERTPSITS
jgi:hypothetical protein